MNKLLLYISIIIISVSSSVGQNVSNYNDNWVFGLNHRMDFSSGTPTYVAGSSIGTTNIEGVSAISDGNGNLLFYTDGTSVYDANDNPMPNGNGNLDGYFSATSACVITKVIDDCDRYYVFYLSDEDPSTQIELELKYSIVDMSLNGGLGDVDVAVTNQVAFTSAVLSEKMITAQKGLTNDYWIILRDGEEDKFHSIEINSTGIGPVTTSTISLTPFSLTAPALTPTLGWIAVSPQGDALVEANGFIDCFLYDFDSNTGLVSNQEILINNAYPAPAISLGYGCEFSSDGQIVYIGVFDGATGGGLLYQFDKSGGVGTAAPTVQTYPMPGGYIVLRRREDDGKIYAMLQGQTGLTVINDPNNYTTPNITFNTHLLGGGGGDLSLANDFKMFVAPIIPPNIAGVDQSDCPGNTYDVGCSSCDSIYGVYDWQPSAMISGSNNVKSPTTVALNADQEFTLAVLNDCGDTITTDTIQVTMSSTINVSLTTNSPICEGESLNVNASPAGFGAGNYSWTGPNGTLGGAGLANIHIVPFPNPIPGGWYYVSVNDNGCIGTDSAFVVSNPTYNITDTISVCSGNSYTYADGTISSNITVNESHVSSFQTVASCDSIITEYISVISNTTGPTIFTPNSWYCVGDNLSDIISDVGDLWYTDPALTNQIGNGNSLTPPVVVGVSTYYVIDTANGCTSATSSVDVEFVNCTYPCGTNLISNPGFENYANCPNGPSDFNELDDWLNIHSTSNDYFNCGHYGHPGGTTFPPISGVGTGMFFNPEGSGYVGMIIGGASNTGGEGFGQQVNLEKCADYTFQFRAALNNINNVLDNNICIYGGNTPTATNCMTGYDLLACIPAADFGLNWNVHTVSFTSPDDYAYFAITGSCPTTGTANLGGYLYLDDFFLCEDLCANQATNISNVNINGDTCSTGTGSATINFDINCYTSHTFDWTLQGGSSVSTDSIATGLTAGTYDVTVTDENACTITTAVTIPFVTSSTPAPIIHTPNSWYCLGDNITDLISDNGDLWFDDVALTSQVGNGVNFTPPATVGITTYYVVDTSGGCFSTASSVNVEFVNCTTPCPTNLLGNGDFEGFSTCPTANGEINLANTWQSYSAVAIVDDAEYFNCGYTGHPAWSPPFSNVPASGRFYNPSGSGYAGFYLGGLAINAYENVGQSFDLKKCVEYTIQFRMAHDSARGVPTNDIVIYGSNSTSSNSAYTGFDALATLPATDVTINWDLHTLTFTPTQDYSEIVIGGAATPNGVTSADGGYVFIDDVFMCESVCAHQATNISNVNITGDTCSLNTGVATINFDVNCYTSHVFDWTLQGGSSVSTDSIATGLAAGTYDVTVTDDNSCTITTSVVIPNIASNIANAGTGNTLSICATDPSTDLFNLLTNNPDLGGSWSPVLNSTTGVFDPAIDAGGTYYYIVSSACGSDSSSIVVTINNNPDPGLNGTLMICANGLTTDLFIQLTGSPDTGGTWSPALASGSGMFNPAVDAAGTYTYTVNACGGGVLTSEVVVTINPLANSGSDGVLSTCANGTPTDLFTLLGGTPDTTGVWSPAMASATGVFDPILDAAGAYTYTVTNSCGSSANEVIVSIVNPPYAGEDTTIDVCSNDALIDLFAIIPSNPDIGGTWNTGAGTFDPSTGNSGLYTYLVSATGCVDDSSTVTVLNNPQPTVGFFVVDDNCQSEIGEITLAVSGGTPTYAYSWNTGETASAITGLLAGTYVVTVTDNQGCSKTKQIDVANLEVDCQYHVYVPNTFSPNGDGQNDMLYVRGQGIQTLSFKLYNRWGNLVFETTNKDIGWDGTLKDKEQDNAVFVYVLDVTYINGSEEQLKGNVTVVK